MRKRCMPLLLEGGKAGLGGDLVGAVVVGNAVFVGIVVAVVVVAAAALVGFHSQAFVSGIAGKLVAAAVTGDASMTPGSITVSDSGSIVPRSSSEHCPGFRESQSEFARGCG